MLFEGRYKTQDYFRYFLYLFSVPSFIFSKNGRGLILVYPQRIVSIIHYLYSKDGFTYGHSIQYKMLLVRLHVYRSIYPLPHMAILGSTSSAANRDMMSKIWINGDKII